MATTIPVQATRYNELRAKVNKVLGTSGVSDPTYGYGQTVNSVNVTGNYDVNLENTDKITAEQYKDLYTDLIRIRAHQVGPSSVTIDPFVEGDFENNPGSADKIELAYIQSLESLAVNIETDRFLIDTTTQADIVNLEDSSGSQIRSIRRNSIYGTWNSTISHIFQVSFIDSAARRHFFNSGGEVRLNPSVIYAGSQSKAIDWQTQMAAIGSVIFKANQTRSSLNVGTGTSVGNNNLTSTYQECYSKAGGAAYANNDYVVSVRNVSDSVLQFKVDFRDLGPNNPTFGIDEAVEGDFLSSVQLLQPNGTVTINGETVDTVKINTLPVGNTIGELSGIAVAPTYSLSSSASTVNEGGSFTITLTTSGVSNNTLIPYTVTGVSSSDLSTGSLSGNFTVNSVGVATASFSMSNDSLTEGIETFRLALDNNQASVTVFVNDTSIAPPPPSITYSVSPSTTSVNEGSSVTFTVSTTNFGSGTLYWTVESVFGTVNANDFSTSLSGSVSISNNTGSFVVTTRADSSTEGTEQFRVRLRTVSASGTIVATSSTITINDTSTTSLPPPPPPPPPPSITYSVSPSTTSVNEGSSVTFTVSTTNFGSGVLYWTVESVSGTINSSDFTSSQSGSVSISNNTGSFVVTTRADATTEGTEQFRVRLRRTSISGTIVATSSTITINDTSRTPVAGTLIVTPATSTATWYGQIPEPGAIDTVTLTASGGAVTVNSIGYSTGFGSFTYTGLTPPFTLNSGSSTTFAVYAQSNGTNVISIDTNVGTYTHTATVSKLTGPVTLAPRFQQSGTTITTARSGDPVEFEITLSAAHPTRSLTYRIPWSSTNISGGSSGSVVDLTVPAGQTRASVIFPVTLISNSSNGSVSAGQNTLNTPINAPLVFNGIRQGGVIVSPRTASLTVTPPPLPTLNPTFRVLSTSYTFPGQPFQTRAVAIQGIWDSTAGGTQTYSLSLSSGLTIDGAVSTPGNTWTSQNTNSVGVLIGPHSAGTATITVSRDGYQSRSITINIPANSTYTPYTFARGFPQEFSNLTSTQRSYAQTVANTYYRSISTPFTTSPIGGRTTWYGAGRRPDAAGVAYWGQYCTQNGISPTSLAFRNAIFTAVNAAGPGNPDYEACIRSSKAFRSGTGYNEFIDRP